MGQSHYSYMNYLSEQDRLTILRALSLLDTQEARELSEIFNNINEILVKKRISEG